MLAEMLLGDPLGPLFPVVGARARVPIALPSVVLHPREDGVTVPRDLDVLRIDSLRPVQAVEVHEPSERRLDERVRWDVGAEVLQGQRLEANVRGTRLFPERLDPLHRPGVPLRLDPEPSEDLEPFLRALSMEVIVEETV